MIGLVGTLAIAVTLARRTVLAQAKDSFRLIKAALIEEDL